MCSTRRLVLVGLHTDADHFKALSKIVLNGEIDTVIIARLITIPYHTAAFAVLMEEKMTAKGRKRMTCNGVSLF